MALPSWQADYSAVFPGGTGDYGTAGPKFSYDSTSSVYYINSFVPACYQTSTKTYHALMPLFRFNRCMGEFDKHMHKTVADSIASAKREIKAEMAAEVAKQVLKAVQPEIATVKAELQTEMNEKLGKIADEQKTAAAAVRSLEDKTTVMERSLSETASVLRENIDKMADEQRITASAMVALEVAVHGLSAATQVAQEALDKAVAAEEKTKATLQTLEGLVAASAPGVDATGAKKAYSEAKDRAARCKASLDAREAADDAIRDATPAIGHGLKTWEQQVENRILEAVATSFETMQEPLDRKMDEVILKLESKG